jgi:hypothetical protein
MSSLSGLNAHKGYGPVYTSMRFPSLETMITYGIYTVKELERFAKGLVPKKKIVCLSECKRCDFVYSGQMCLNCQV